MAVKFIVKHLMGTRHTGIQAQIDIKLGLVEHTDLDFANGWSALNLSNVNSLFSRMGYATHFISMLIT